MGIAAGMRGRADGEGRSLEEDSMEETTWARAISDEDSEHDESSEGGWELSTAELSEGSPASVCWLCWLRVSNMFSFREVEHGERKYCMEMERANSEREGVQEE